MHSELVKFKVDGPDGIRTYVTKNKKNTDQVGTASVEPKPN